MRLPMLFLAGLCLLLALAPALLWPVLLRVCTTWNPDWAQPQGAATLPSGAPLGTLALVQLGFALALAAAGWWLWRKVRSAGLRRAPTWDCGYAHPTPRMQYTSGSFSELAAHWFRWVLRPSSTVRKPRRVLPSESFHMTTTPEAVLKHVVGPASRLVMRLSTAVRRRQHGHLQSYILYLMAGMITLAILAALGGKP